MNAGSDHAWGGHHFVIGTPVKGGAAYGKFPTLAWQGPDDTGDRGVFIPTTLRPVAHLRDLEAAIPYPLVVGSNPTGPATPSSTERQLISAETGTFITAIIALSILRVDSR